MTEENKIEVKEVKTCFCQSEWFKRFLTKTLAVFIGTFSALSLFAALYKPPMMKPVPYGMKRPCHYQMYHFHKGGPRGDFYRKMEKRDFQKFEKRDFQRPDRAGFPEKPPVKPQ